MRYLYHALILFIGAVSAYDNTMTWIYREVMVEQEENPVGSWLIEQGGVPFFVLVKAVTTLLMVGVLFCLVRTRHRWMIVVVALFQLWLFIYLNQLTEGIPPEQFKFHPLNAWWTFISDFYLIGEKH